MNLPRLLFANLAGFVVLVSFGIPLGAQPLSLTDALRAGESQAPRLAAQRFAVDSAGQQIAPGR